MTDRAALIESPGLGDLPLTDRRGWPFSEATPADPAAEAEAWPRISIVIPSFEQGDYLEETLRSVLLQAYPRLELIVVDGGSSDGSVEILRRYEPWLSWWISEPDDGQSDAINKGFARATGEIITFLGSDDLYERGALLDVGRRYLEGPECGAIVGAFRTLDTLSRRGHDLIPPRLPEPGPQDLTLLDPGSWRLHQVSTFYTRHALDAVGRRVDKELHYTMDRELLFRVALHFPLVLSSECYGVFRRHPESKSVASILPMSREMGNLHLLPGPHREMAEPDSALRRRRRLARYHWARGQWKLACSGVGPGRSLPALLRVLRHRPDFALRRGYWTAWLGVVAQTALGLTRRKPKSEP